MKKNDFINKSAPKQNITTNLEEDLEFILWKAELKKELMTFWKAISE